MKYLGVFFLIAAVLTVNAKSWTVNNNPDLWADFRALTDAQTAASAGDTIYLEPSLKCYPGFTCTKRLVLIGTGYFLAENSTSQNVLLNSQGCSDITFDTGSEGSEMMGISLANNALIIKTSNLVISRNLIKDISFPYQNGGYLHSLYITQNYIYNINGGQYGGKNFFVDIVQFSNNILVNDFSFYYTKYKDDCSCYDQSLIAQCSNNVFQKEVYLQSSILRNNIFTKGNMYNSIYGYFSFNLVDENITAAILPWTDVVTYKISSGNVDNVNMSSLFVGGGSPDAKWQIQPGSTVTLKDKCDAFKGSTPYVLSGIPAVPNIYYLNIPLRGSQKEGINVTIKAKSNQ